MSFIAKLFKPNVAKLSREKDVKRLWEALDHRDEAIRREAEHALKQLSGIPAQPDLLNIVQETYLSGRDNASLAGEVLSKAGEPGAKILLGGLDSDQPIVKRTAVRCLGIYLRLHADPGGAIAGALARPDVIQLLREAYLNDEPGEYEARGALSKLGEAGLKVLLEGLNSSNPSIRRKAAESLIMYAQEHPDSTQAVSDRLGLALVAERETSVRQSTVGSIAMLRDKASLLSISAIWYCYYRAKKSKHSSLEWEWEAAGKALSDLNRYELTNTMFYDQEGLPEEWATVLLCGVESISIAALDFLSGKLRSLGRPIKCPAKVAGALRVACGMRNPDGARLGLEVLRALGEELSASEQEAMATLNAEHREQEVGDRIRQLQIGALTGRAYDASEPPHRREVTALHEKLEAIRWLEGYALSSGTSVDPLSEAAVDALAQALGESGLQKGAVQALAAFGARARKTLAALREVAKEASRPVTEADYAEQLRLGGRIEGIEALTEAIKAKIARGDPLDPELAQLTLAAMKRIESG